MVLAGVVTNVTQFGAFVDVGVHQDGRVHVSELANRFVKDPAEVVKVGERVRVRVIKVDRERRRIGLSIKQAASPAAPAAAPQRATEPGRPGKPEPRKPEPKKPEPPRKQPFNNPFAAALSPLREKK
jgi:uncharacterized protein